MYHLFYRLVIDNYDQEIKARVQSSSTNNTSVHVTNGYAVKNRVIKQDLSKSKPQKSLGDLEMIDVLPGTDVIDTIKDDLVHLIPRTLVRYLPAYSRFKKTVIYHIPHSFSKEMESKSEMVQHIFDI